jgi:hypothetical protein
MLVVMATLQLPNKPATVEEEVVQLVRGRTECPPMAVMAVVVLQTISLGYPSDTLVVVAAMVGLVLVVLPVPLAMVEVLAQVVAIKQGLMPLLILVVVAEVAVRHLATAARVVQARSSSSSQHRKQL